MYGFVEVASERLNKGHQFLIGCETILKAMLKHANFREGSEVRASGKLVYLLEH